MTPGPAPLPPTSPKKKGLSGCVIALLVLGALVLVTCLVGGIAAWRVSQSEEGKKVFSAIGKGVELAEKGMNAPGAAELRAAGCPQAIVLEGDDVMGVVDIFLDGGTRPSSAKLDTMVMCQGQLFDELPDCGELATTYAAAAHPTRPFTVSVRRQGNSKPICQQKYGPGGTPQVE